MLMVKFIISTLNRPFVKYSLTEVHMKSDAMKRMDRTARDRFGKMYLANAVVLIKSSSSRAYQKIMEGCDQARANICIQPYARHRAVLIRPLAAGWRIDSNAKVLQSVDSLVKGLLRGGGVRAIPGYSLTGHNDPPFIFPTGAIFLLLDPKYISSVMRDVRRYPFQLIRRIFRTPILRMQLPPGQEGLAGIIAEQVSHVPGVIAATADFSYYGPYERTIHQPPGQPPTVDAISFLRRNLIDRAWEFGMGNKDIDVAVIDSNFYDHPDMLYRLDHGYDAADNDHDPRSPLVPPDADVSQPGFYRRRCQVLSRARVRSTRSTVPG
jgi:hypothetical protein